MATFKKKIVGKRGKKRKEVFEEDVPSNFESESDQQGSPIYVESEESISDGSEGDGEFFSFQWILLFFAPLLNSFIKGDGLDLGDIIIVQ